MERVAVIGGGLAGLACAAALAPRGFRVTVLESRRRLGGRAGSFVASTKESKFKETIRTTSEHRLGRRRAAAQSIVVIGERWQEPWGDQSRAAYGSIESERGDRSLRRMDPL